MTSDWQALVLAASRGPDDPVARQFGVTHKCLVDIAGVPMVQRVTAALAQTDEITSIHVAIENPELIEAGAEAGIHCVDTAGSAAQTVLNFLVSGQARFPVLLTTGDHAALTAEMVTHFLDQSSVANCDVTVGLATAETILADYPEAIRTFWTFGQDRVSGCNLYGLMTPQSMAAVKMWRHVEANRKAPFKVAMAFGIGALLRYSAGYLTASLTMERAFSIASRRMGITVRPVIMPFAEAAIDVDKPEDKILVERILRARHGHQVATN